MKQYDKIYIDAPENDKWRPTFEDLYVELSGPVIVLSLSELKEVWEAGRRSKHFENNSNALYTDFDSYIQYKGIKTINNG